MTDDQARAEARTEAARDPRPFADTPGQGMSKLAKILAKFSKRLEDKANEMRREHGLPEDHRASEYRKKKERK